MDYKHKIDSEFIGIYKRIVKENRDLKEWRLIESDDQYQTEKYCVGFDGTKNLSLSSLGLIYESSRGNISQVEVMQKMSSLIRIMDNSIQLGLEGTD